MIHPCESAMDLSLWYLVALVAQVTGFPGKYQIEFSSSKLVLLAPVHRDWFPFPRHWFDKLLLERTQVRLLHTSRLAVNTVKPIEAQ